VANTSVFSLEFATSLLEPEMSVARLALWVNE